MIVLIDKSIAIKAIIILMIIIIALFAKQAILKELCK